MILAWAPGGGFGHLTRMAALRHTLGRNADACWIVSGSPAVHDRRIVGDAHGVHLDAGLAGDVVALRRRLIELIADSGADEVWVDAFPAGIRGELATSVPAAARVGVGADATIDWPDLPTLRWRHAARRLRLDVYTAATAPADDWPHFDRIDLTETIDATQLALISSHSHDTSRLDLVEPPAPEPTATERDLVTGAWLVVHSGPADETDELCAYARERAAAEGDPAARIVVIGPGGLDRYPAWPLFAPAHRIVTAAGANVVRQTETFAERRVLLPFPRRFDDQFARARAARQSSSRRMSGR